MSINHTRHSRQVRRGRNVTWSHVVPKCVTNFFAPFLMGSSHALPHLVLRRVANSTNFASAPGTWAYVVLKCVTDFLTLRSCIKRYFIDALSHFILEALLMLISHIFFEHAFIILDKKTIIASQCWGIWLWWRRGVDWEILIRKRLSTGQSNRGHIRWHVWRYNLTRHAIQPDTSGSKTIARNAWSTIKPARSCQAVWSEGAETNCYSRSCHFHCWDKFIPNQIGIIILCHQQCVVMCGSS